MCGIFGYITDEKNEQGKVLAKELISPFLLYSAKRGQDASGIAYHSEGKLKVIKKMGHPSSLIASKEFQKFMKSDKLPSVLIGHTRLPTAGSPKNNNNNHPLLSEKHGIAVVHNGSAYAFDYEEAFKKHKFKREWEVDTELILRILERYSRGNPKKMITAIKKTGEIWDGTMTCASILAKTDKFLWVWKDTNPLYFALFGDVLFFASDEDFLVGIFSDRFSKAKWGLFRVSSPEEREVLYEEGEDMVIYRICPNKVETFILPDTKEDEEEGRGVEIYREGRRVSGGGYGSGGGFGSQEESPSSPLSRWERTWITNVSVKRLRARRDYLKNLNTKPFHFLEEEELIDKEIARRGEKENAANALVGLDEKVIPKTSTSSLKKRGRHLLEVAKELILPFEEKELVSIETELKKRRRTLV